MPAAWAPDAAPRVRPRPAVEVADIFRAHGAAYRHAHGLARAQRRAMQAIETCRTAALGGHRETCDTCGAERIAYNSCRNRHCPKCQTLAKDRWLAARRAELLPVEYFHVVFTLPHALNALAQGNPRVIYTLLFRAVAATLTTFGRDPRHLGGDVGGTAILHTWGQNLSQHLHLHCVVTGGALTQDGARWIAAPPGFLFPVRALARVFRGKYLQALHRAFITGKLRFAGSLASLAEPEAFATWLRELRQHDWIVYATTSRSLEIATRWVYRPRYSRSCVGPANGRLRPHRGRRALPLERLRRRRPHEDHDAHGRGIHPSLSPSRRPGRLCPHSPLRLPRQPLPSCQARAVPGPPRPAPSTARSPDRIRVRAHAPADRDRHRPLSHLPARPAARHRDPRPDVPAHAMRPSRGHVVIAPSPARARPPDPPSRSCATCLLRARRPAPARLGPRARTATRPPAHSATLWWWRRRQP